VDDVAVDVVAVTVDVVAVTVDVAVVEAVVAFVDSIVVAVFAIVALHVLVPVPATQSAAVLSEVSAWTSCFD
jgi:hypothetical protein